MHIFCVDDDPFHRSKSKKIVETACQIRGITDYEIIECSDGKDFLQKTIGKSPRLVLLDINMPNMDGLSALVRAKVLYPQAIFMMASSENEQVISRHSSTHHDGISPEKQKELIAKVVDRVRSGVQEAGKINSVLEAISQLGADPIPIAKQQGAVEFLQKPYDLDVSSKIIAKYL